jgi:hypothetical protein
MKLAENFTLTVEIIRELRPQYAWTKSFVLLFTSTVKVRIVVFCTPATGTPESPVDMLVQGEQVFC